MENKQQNGSPNPTRWITAFNVNAANILLNGIYCRTEWESKTQPYPQEMHFHWNDTEDERGSRKLMKLCSDQNRDTSRQGVWLEAKGTAPNDKITDPEDVTVLNVVHLMTGLQHPRGKTWQLQGEIGNPTILAGALNPTILAGVLTPSFRVDRANNNKKNVKVKKQITEKICNVMSDKELVSRLCKEL